MSPTLRTGALLLWSLCAAIPARALNPPSSPGASYTGDFANDADQRIAYFTLSQAGAVTLRTWSYAGGVNFAGATISAGGFDPTISVFDAQGNFMVDNRDGGCSHVAADPVTSFCWDSYLNLTLPTGNYSVVLTQSDNLPNGPTLSDSFVYSGQPSFTTPPGVATMGFWDMFPSQRTRAYALDILGAASVITTVTSSPQLPYGITGQSYSFTFAAASGPGANLTWSIVSGSLPPGVTLNASTGVLSGVTAAAGAYSFAVQVTDGVQPVTQNVSMAVYDPVGILSSSIPAGLVGATYGPIGLSAAGGSGNYSWSVVGLPSNLTANASGAISGVPEIGGTFPITVSVSDPVTGLNASAAFTLTVAFAPLSITSSGSLGEYTPGAVISGAFAVIGGKAPYTWTASGLPAGVSLDSATGAFSGTAGTPGNYSFSIQVSDSETPAITKTLGVTYSVLGIATSALPQASTTTAYAANVTGLGGTPPYSFSATGLPLGLSLSSSGSFSGTPQAVGNFTVVVKVSDVSLLSSSSTFLLVVTGPPSPLTVSGGALANGAVAAAYLASVRATGGAPPYSWSVLGGALPRGVSVSGAGIVQGVPTAPGVYSFTAEATDSSGATASATYTLTISPAPLTLSLGALPNGIAGADYPVQILTVSGGVAPYAAAITTGSLPAGLTLSGLQIVESSVPSTPGTYAFTITVTDSTGQTASGAGSILINPMSANLVLSQTNVAFSLVAGASGVPSPASVTVASSLVATILNDSFSVSPAASWLDVSSGPTTPAAIAIAIDPTAPSLPASTTPYTTTINVSCAAPSPCAGSVQTIDVSLVVSAPPPQLTVGSGLLSFGASSANPVSSSQSLGLQNTGGGVITVYSITAADAWVSVSNPPSSLTAGPSQTAIVTVNPAGLASGYYRSTITVDSSAGLATVPVTLIISQDLTLTLGPSGSQFSAPAGSSPGNSTGSFSVSVTGAGAANWNASVLTGASWLVLTSAAGSSTESSAATAGFSLNASAISSLAPATYYGTIQVTSGDVVNSPQDYQVVLDITPAAAPTVTALNTAGLVFTSSFAGSTSPQSVAVYSSSAAPTAYQASSATTDGANWLSVSPATGTASAGSPASSSVSVNVAGLAPGVYSGGVSYASSSDGVRTVNVSLLVLPAGTAVASSITSFPPAGANAAICTPKRLIATQTGLYGNFAQLAGLPAPVSIKLIDDCGAAVTGAGVIATFSNGDPPLMLQALDSTSGNYSGTWTPQTSAPQVSVTATAMEPPLPAATATVTGIVMANNAPILSQNGVVHVFNRLVGAGLAPGEIVEIYGDNLASQTVTDMAVPLPTVLAGTSVSIGNIPAPLFYVSPVQIDAQIPWTLTPGNQYQIQVNANGAVSTPGSVTIVPAAPGIAAAASGLALAQHNADFSSVTESSPARPGEYVVLYLAGLGATDTVVATGAAAPSSPLIHPLISPTLTLDGSSVPIAFVGLVPGYVGLYQIDVQIPANAPNGDLLLSVGQPGAVASNVTILPVQQ